MKEITLTAGSQTINVFVNEQDGEQWVAITPLCEAVGLQVARQRQKIISNPQFKSTHMCRVAEDGRSREMICIPVRQIGMWICNINASKVKPDLQEKLLIFQEHLQHVIHNYLTGGVTMAMFHRLEAQVEHLTAELAKAQETNTRLCNYILTGETSRRFEEAEASIGGKLMSAKRWVKRDRERARELLN